MKKMIAVSLAMIVMTVSWCRSETAWYQAMTSESALKTYCEERVAFISAGFYGMDVVSISGGDSWSWTEVQNANSALRELSRLKYTFGAVSGSKNPIYAGAYFYDKNYQFLYWGETKARKVKTSNGWSVETGEIEMQLTDYPIIEVPYENVSAYVDIERDGYTERVYLNCDGSQVYFPVELAGQGQIVLRDTYGQTVVLNLKTGQFAPIDEFTASLTARYEGHISCIGGIKYQVQSEGGVGVSPIFDLQVTTGTAFVSVKTSEGELPTGIWVRATPTEGVSSDWQYFQYSIDGVTLDMEPGEYQVYCVWEYLQDPMDRQYEWYWYGDKG